MKRTFFYKTELIYHGMKLSQEVEMSLKKGRNGVVKATDYVTTTGLLLRLNEDTYVTADIKLDSPFELTLLEGAYVMNKNGERVFEVMEIIQPPQFSLDDTYVNNIVAVHADRVRVAPIGGCAFRCGYCSANEIPYILKPMEQIESALCTALKLSNVHHILISGGTPRTKQSDYDYLSNVYKYIGEKYGLIYPVDVMMFPRSEYVGKTSKGDYLSYLKKLKEWSISGLSINLELWSNEARQWHIPQKAGLSKEKFLEFLQLAVEVFGGDKVRSSLIVGLESEDDTLTAVEEMCKVGCMPMLSPYIPYGEVQKSPSVTFMNDVLIKADVIAEKYGMILGPTCAPCRHNVLHTGREMF